MSFTPKFPTFLHGGDYNPEQWINEKDTIWPIDMALAKKAGVNTLSVGIFAWSMLEPEEGVYNYAFIEDIIKKAIESNCIVNNNSPKEIFTDDNIKLIIPNQPNVIDYYDKYLSYELLINLFRYMD